MNSICRRTEKEKRLYRQSMSESKRKQYNEDAKTRMRKYRSQFKEKRTPKQKAQDRKRWREAKRRQRAAMSPLLKKEKEIQSLKRRLQKLSADDFAEIAKKNELSRRGMEVSSHRRQRFTQAKAKYGKFRKQIKRLKSQRKNTSRIKLKLLTSHLRTATKASTLRLGLGIRWKSLQKYSMISEESELSELANIKKRADAIPEEERNDIANYYEDNSIP